MKKIKENEKVYFRTNSLFEETEVIEINKAQNLAILKNRVMVIRKSETNQFDRPDGKPGFALKITEETQELYSKYLVYNELKKALDEFLSAFKNGFESQSLTQMQNLLRDLKK